MSAIHVKRGLKLFERIHNKPLVLLLVLYVILLAIYVGFFYVLLTSNPWNSLQNTARSNDLPLLIVPNSQFDTQTVGNATPAKLPDQDDANSSTTSEEKTSRRVSQNVTVNGQSVPVLKNGSSHTVIKNNGDVDVSITSRSTGESDVSSSLEVNVETSTSSVKEVEQ